jgi:hypothetical protein
MTLNEIQVRQLLACAMAYDNRKPGDANVAAWMDAAARARWTFEAAVEAIKAHYAEETAFCMPAHITKRLKDGQGSPPRYVALPAAEPASDETRRRIMQMIGNRFSMPRR